MSLLQAEPQRQTNLQFEREGVGHPRNLFERLPHPGGLLNKDGEGHSASRSNPFI